VQLRILVPGRTLKVRFAAKRQGARQFRMADEFHAGPLECQIAQQMIRMDMRIDHIAHRPIGHPPDSAIESMPFGNATTGIDYRNTALADHETNVRNLVTFKYDRSMAEPYVNT
jgi:hypothetical protein